MSIIIEVHSGCVIGAYRVKGADTRVFVVDSSEVGDPYVFSELPIRPLSEADEVIAKAFEGRSA